MTTAIAKKIKMTAIEFENISKQYRLGLVSTRTLRHDLNRWWMMNILGKEDPYLKIGEENDRAHKGSSEYVWALKDINFKVEQGDVLGIIGKNGAGKSTLLKILSKVTTPTTGIIRANGRIASLLEVGTGFHPEMTGRENIYMNGAIMGMTKSEITRKLDEIVDFSGVERYLDTPVKRYSSGMTVRLGFAIAAHLEPEILVVDEVLAVGDAEFQKKAIGKMQDVSRGEGRTVLFVSHNMGAVKNLCTKGIILENGKLVYSSTALDAVDEYLKKRNTLFDDNAQVQIMPGHRDRILSLDAEILSVGFKKNKTNFASQEPIVLTYRIKGNKDVDNFHVGGIILNFDDQPVGIYFGEDTISIKKGEEKEIEISIIDHNLGIGKYYINMGTGKGNHLTGVADYDIVNNVLNFEIDNFDESGALGFAKWFPVWGNVLFKTKYGV